MNEVLCNTLASVPGSDYSAFLTCDKIGQFAIVQKKDPGHWDMNEFNADIRVPTAAELNEYGNFNLEKLN